jgi:hypothetical protein
MAAAAGPEPKAPPSSTETALARLSSLDNGRSRLLYLYQRGLLLHEAGDWTASNEALDRAEDLLEDLYTKSISKEVGSLLIGDYLLEYRGERFESAFVHYYKIMNYLALDEPDEAVVECRRLNHRLQVIRDAGGSFYADDPFLQYLTARIYAMTGNLADADVSYRVALESYRAHGSDYGAEMPARLVCDVAATARALGKTSDAERMGANGGCVATRASQGTLTVFLECDRVPTKVENSLVLPIFKDEITEHMDRDAYARKLCTRRDDSGHSGHDLEIEYWLKIALPELRTTPASVRFARVYAVRSDSAGAADDEAMAEATRAANLEVLATKSFEEDRGAILLRAVTRALLKYLATRTIKGKSDEAQVAKQLVNLAGVLTESADTRCWSALPGQILVTSLDLEPGRYRIEVDLFGPSRRRAGFLAFDGVEVRAGKNTVLSRRVN